MNIARTDPGPGKVLSLEQQQFYADNGYLAVDQFISADWLDRLRKVTDEFIEESRGVSKSGDRFDVEPDHSADNPRLRRLNGPVEQHQVYRDFTLQGPLLDLAEDLLGPNIKYHHSKLNFKWAGGGEEVKWHQDFPFWPHTNFSPMTIGLYLDDVDEEMGPLGILPGSHQGPLYDHYDGQGNWTGAIAPGALDPSLTDGAVYLAGRAGSVTIHNCVTVHGSKPNLSSRSRNLLLQTYAAADAIVLTDLVRRWSHSDMLVRGEHAGRIRTQDCEIRMPPDWSGGYTSIFALQQGDNE